ncbi:hypothetical protein C4N20_10405 [Fusobacterium ulcerans]|uniref:Uncharacterized protein n=1 Tax=Fusobacterium ulcerans TaxID=861 RepID=A0AAX2J961_9FUSO|nr:hypothetical protein [Fusobacterium ulcerans]AVQ28475.1 hypothetical protein C4N20_10405 [Fusobacterium ulcerans]EFS25942.1 hypothetical protein FUAG_01457 [Fusobacterium ulcerans ATCC 49185]SQJ00314.1 Uncharacterised protein [Fusobacterium ulcerans]
MVVSFLITGAIGYGAYDIVAQGEIKFYITLKVGSGNPKIICGWNYITDLTKNEDHSTDETSITLKSGTIDELIGENHLKKVDYKGEVYLYSIGNTSVTMNDETVQYLIGGSKSNGTKANIKNGEIKISAFSGSLGVEFKKDNKTFEVGYSLYSSKHETENRGTMSFKYNF